MNDFSKKISLGMSNGNKFARITAIISGVIFLAIGLYGLLLAFLSYITTYYVGYSQNTSFIFGGVSILFIVFGSILLWKTLRGGKERKH